MLTFEELKNLPDRSHLKAVTSWNTWYGIYHKKETDKHYGKNYMAAYAYWEKTLGEAIKAREAIKPCPCYSGLLCSESPGTHLTTLELHSFKSDNSMTPDEIKSLPDGAHIRGTTNQRGYLYGIYHRKATEYGSGTPNNKAISIGQPFTRIYAYWEDSVDRAIESRNKASTCSCYSGELCEGRSGLHLSFLGSVQSITKTSQDDCICPMLPGGLINHTSTCSYILSRVRP